MSWRCCKDTDARNKINCQIIFGILRDQKNTSLLSQAVKMAPSAAGNALLFCCGSGCGQRWERWAAAMLSADEQCSGCCLGQLRWEQDPAGTRARGMPGTPTAAQDLVASPVPMGSARPEGAQPHGQPLMGRLSLALLSGQSHYPHQHITMPLKDI